MKPRLAIVSGYFNPLHIGHLRLMQEARKLGPLHVIVNNDVQQLLKKGRIIMAEDQRAALVDALNCVSGVTIALDNDASIAKTLENVAQRFGLTHDLVFCNGGDRPAESLPDAEAMVCAAYSIEMRYGVGGDTKADSSTRINAELAAARVPEPRCALVETVNKPWGRERLWARVPGQYVGKFLDVRAGQRLSLQWHVQKDETMTLVSGEGYLEIGPDAQNMQRVHLVPFEGINIPPGVFHRLVAVTDICVAEVSTDHLSDVVRVQDDFSRAQTV